MTQQWHHEGGEGSKREAAASQARRKRMKTNAQARKTGIMGDEVEQPHDAVLAVRPFTSVDFSEMVPLMPPEWSFPGMSENERLAQAQMDVATSLAESTFALVATVDDGTYFDPVCAGYLLARISGESPLAGRDNWLTISENAARELETASPAARNALTYDRELAERGQLLLDAAKGAQGPDNELVLFVAGPQARGHGAGNALLNTFEDHLRTIGQTSYWLQTDTSCTWWWYERHGFTRIADVELASTYVMPPALAQDGSADPALPAHAYLYRKDL